MASLRVLAFDPKGRPIQFDTWLDDLQLYLLSDSRDSVSLFDHTSGAAPAPPATIDIATRSQWLTHDASARLAIRNHLPLAECAHFGQQITAQALYDAVVARYSSPATAALGRLLLPYQSPELNPPPMYITLYFIVTRIPDSLRAVTDHFLALDPTALTIDLLEHHLLAAETSIVAVGAAHGSPCTPCLEGCSPSPLAPSYNSAAAFDVLGADDAGAASASAKRRSSKGKGGRGRGGGSGDGSAGSTGVGGGNGGGGSGGSGGRSGGFGGGSGGSGGIGGGGSGGSGGDRNGAPHGGSGRGQRQQQQRRSETPCTYVIRTGDRAGQTCGKLHSEHHCFSCLDDAWHAYFGDKAERPRWVELLRPSVAIFDLDYDAIFAATYALSVSAKSDCYLCVPPDPGIEAAALGASESIFPGTAPAEALHTFTLYSGASRCFFRDSTTLTPLSAPVPVRLADPSGGPILARSSTFLPCPADAMVTTTTPGGQRVSICTCTRTGHHLAMFTRQPGSSLCTLATEPPQVVASVQVSASGQVAPPCSCCLLSHQTLLWHHRLGHPSLPRLDCMHSRRLVSGLHRSLPPLPPSPAPPCLPCIEGWQCAAPHSSSFPPTSAPQQTLHMDVKGQVVDVLIPWIRAVRLQLRKRFRADLLVLCLHSDRGGESPPTSCGTFVVGRAFSSLMEVARTSMIHAAAPHFLWPFAVRYAAHQLNLWPRVSMPETSPTLRWTRKVGNVSVFWVWGSRAFVRDTSADKLSARAILCIFLGFSPDAPGWQFYHPTSRSVFPSHDVTFGESVPFYRLFPNRSAPTPPPLLFLTPGPPLVEPPGGAESEGAGSGGAELGGAELASVKPGGAEPECVEPGGAESEGAESWGAEPRSTASSGGPAGASPRLFSWPEPLSRQHLREWFAQCTRLWSGAAGVGDSAAGGVQVTARDGGTGGATAVGPGGACTRGIGVVGTGGVGGAGAGDPTEPGAAGAVGARAGGPGAVDSRAGGARGTVRPRPYFVPLLQQVLGVPSSTGLTPPLVCPPLDQSQPPLQPASPLPAPSPYTKKNGGFTERCEPASHPASLVRTCRLVSCPRPPPVLGTHVMELRPSSVPLRVPLPPPLESSLPIIPDPKSDRARAATPTVSLLLATIVTAPTFESTAASALFAELLDFAAACRLDYATALIAESAESESAAAVPRFASMLLAPEGDPDVPDIPTPCSYAEAITGPYSSQWQAAMDAEMASWKSTGTYVDAVPPSRANIVNNMWIFRVKRPLGSPPAFKAHYVARGFNHPGYSTAHHHQILQRFAFQFSSPQPTPLSTSHSLSAPPSDEFVEPSGTYLELVGCLIYLMTRPDLVYPLSLLARYVALGRHQNVHWDAAKRVLRYLCSTSGMGLVLGGRGPVFLTGHADASWVDNSATQRSSQGYTFSLGSGSVSWRSTRSSSVLSSSCEAEIYAGAMAAQELRWLTNLPNDLGEQPRSPPILINSSSSSSSSASLASASGSSSSSPSSSRARASRSSANSSSSSSTSATSASASSSSASSPSSSRLRRVSSSSSPNTNSPGSSCTPGTSTSRTSSHSTFSTTSLSNNSSTSSSSVSSVSSSGSSTSKARAPNKPLTQLLRR
ncbi:unnamed protein product [Closterium sp. NIES-54]